MKWFLGSVSVFGCEHNCEARVSKCIDSIISQIDEI